MKLKVFVCSLILGCLFAVSLYAKNIPKEELAELPEYPEAIVQQLEKHDVMQLINDDYFLRVLSKELKNKNSTAEEKVYFFYQMLQKIQWAFCGGIGVPMSDNYAHHILFHCITFEKYRKYLSKRNIDDKQFFDLVYNNIEEKPILAAYSFLLGSFVTEDIGKSFEICEKAYFDEKIFDKSTWFRSMFIHNMMLLAPPLMSFTYNEDSFAKYSILCQSIIDNSDLKEEEKEDLVMGFILEYDVDNFGHLISYNIRNEKNEDNDSLILTCFNLAQNRLNEDYFKQFVDLSIAKLEESENDAWKKNLIERYIKANNYKVDYFKGLNATKGVYNKSWDNISMIAYDDGILYCDDDYAEFEPNNTK